MDKSTNRVLGAIVGLVLVVAAVVAVVGNKPVAQIDRSKPEGVVQAYLQSVLAHKFDEAAGYFDPAGTCSADNLVQSYIPQDARVSLTDSTVTASTATVTVSVETPSSDPFGGGYTETHTYRLTQDAAGGTWRLAGIPWPLYDCGVVK